MAPPETDSESRATTRENLRIVFLYPYGGDCESGSFTASAADCSDNSAGKCGQICGGGLPKLRSSKANSEEPVTSWHHTSFCRIDAHDDLAQVRISSVSRGRIRFAREKCACLNLSRPREMFRSRRQLSDDR